MGWLLFFDVATLWPPYFLKSLLSHCLDVEMERAHASMDAPEDQQPHVKRPSGRSNWPKVRRRAKDMVSVGVQVDMDNAERNCRRGRDFNLREIFSYVLWRFRNEPESLTDQSPTDTDGEENRDSTENGAAAADVSATAEASTRARASSDARARAQRLPSPARARASPKRARARVDLPLPARARASPFPARARASPTRARARSSAPAARKRPRAPSSSSLGD